MRAKYVVTFEFSMRAPITIRGEVEGGTAQTLFTRAMKYARIQAKTPESIAKNGTINYWSSISVLVDRFDFMKIKEGEVEALTESESEGASDSKEEV